MNASEGIIPYGIQSIDNAMCGVCRKEITVLAGRPSHGKTSMAVQFIINWLEAGFRVLFISKEMSTGRLIHKFISNLGRISSQEIKKGSITDTEYFETVASSIISRYKDKLFIYDDVYKATDVEALIIKHKPDIVVDDFLQMTDFGNIRPEHTRIAIKDTLIMFKDLSKEYNIAYFVLSQLSRSIEGREDPIPRMSDLAESAAIEWLAGDVCFVYYPYKVTYDVADRSKIKYVVSKARYGESCIVPLGFDGDHMRYYALPTLSKEAS